MSLLISSIDHLNWSFCPLLSLRPGAGPLDLIKDCGLYATIWVPGNRGNLCACMCVCACVWKRERVFAVCTSVGYSVSVCLYLWVFVALSRAVVQSCFLCAHTKDVWPVCLGAFTPDSSRQGPLSYTSQHSATLPLPRVSTHAALQVRCLSHVPSHYAIEVRDSLLRSIS